MKPGILIDKEGYRIFLAKTQVRDPQLRYRTAVEHVASEGVIFLPDRPYLDELRNQLGLSQSDADDIEVKVLHAYRTYQENLGLYKKIFSDTVSNEPQLSDRTRNKLREFQTRWSLKLEDVLKIESKIIQDNKEPQIPDDIPNLVPYDGSKSSDKSIKPEPWQKRPILAILLMLILPIFSFLGVILMTQKLFTNNSQTSLTDDPSPGIDIDIPNNSFPNMDLLEELTVSTSEPIEVNSCIIKVSHPLGDDFPGGKKSSIKLHEQPSDDSALITNVDFSEYEVLYRQLVRPFAKTQKWYQINHNGKLGWIKVSSINLSSLEIPSSCP